LKGFTRTEGKKRRNEKKLGIMDPLSSSEKRVKKNERESEGDVGALVGSLAIGGSLWGGVVGKSKGGARIDLIG